MTAAKRRGEALEASLAELKHARREAENRAGAAEEELESMKNEMELKEVELQVRHYSPAHFLISAICVNFYCGHA